MKKIILFFSIFCAVFATNTNAQFAACNASFTYNYLTANNIKFVPAVNLGSPYAYHVWKFGDGTPDSTTVSPTHVYAANGVYNVMHIINTTGTAGTNIVCRDTITSTISIANTNTCTLQSNFTSSGVASSAFTYFFTNTSIGAAPIDSIRWTFGDGSSSSIYNPSHTYASAGQYNVCLRIIKRNPNGVLVPTCASEICSIVNVIAPTPTCTVQASFNNVATPGTTNPLSLYFTNTSTNIVTSDSIRWTFGDGSSASTYHANHVYANYGTYNVCLRVIKRINGVLQPNCASDTCIATTIVAPINPCNVQAFFTTSISNNIAPAVVQFFNQSTGVLPTDTIRWNFGDGSPSIVSNVNLAHTYANAGTYTACIRIKRLTPAGSVPCIREYCTTFTIVPAPPVCNLAASFTANPAIVTIPFTRNYLNTSVGAAATDSIRWTFGDGTSASTYNATHTYASAGIYNVCIRIIKRNPNGVLQTNCIREFCKLDTITPPITPCTLQALFTVGTATSINSLSQYFTNTSTGAAATDSIRWTFGDGTSASTFNATHTYANYGTYNVCLRIVKRNAAGVLQTNCASEFCRVVTITAPNPCNVQAYFSITSSSTTAPAAVVFTNQSTGILPTDSVRWIFGDGTFSLSNNPVHTYANAGTYTACIRIKRLTPAGAAPCVREYCKIITILPPVTYCNISANFTWMRDTAVTIPNLYHFTNTTIGLSSTDSIRWSFGDGTFSNAVNPNHSYAQVGPYQVCIRVQKRNSNGVLVPNCVSEKCYTVVVAAPTNMNCNNVTLSFTNTQDPLYQNRRRFTAVANAAILNQSWTITRMPITASSSSVIINQFNPTYAFLDSGYYRVCLKAIFANNCVKEYCSVIHIANNTPTTNACNLQLYPNPTSNTVTGVVTLSQPLILYAFIYNSQNMLVAQKIQQGAVGINNVSVNVANLPAGIYRYRLYYGFQSCVSTFVKQ